jgi:hypothetical protein
VISIFENHNRLCPKLLILHYSDKLLAGCGKSDAATQIVSGLCDFVTKECLGRIRWEPVDPFIRFRRHPLVLAYAA